RAVSRSSAQQSRQYSTCLICCFSVLMASSIGVSSVGRDMGLQGVEGDLLRLLRHPLTGIPAALLALPRLERGGVGAVEPPFDQVVAAAARADPLTLKVRFDEAGQVPDVRFHVLEHLLKKHRVTPVVPLHLAEVLLVARLGVLPPVELG